MRKMDQVQTNPRLSPLQETGKKETNITGGVAGAARRAVSLEDSSLDATASQADQSSDGVGDPPSQVAFSEAETLSGTKPGSSPPVHDRGEPSQTPCSEQVVGAQSGSEVSQF